MPRQKIEKIAAFKKLPCAFEATSKLSPDWVRTFFGNDAPLILELACGRGEYTLALAEKYPQKNIVGIDIKGARLWKGARQAMEKKLPNVAFLRCYISDLISYLPKKSVTEIWITFPDPHPKPSKANKRVTSQDYLKLYRQLLTPGGLIHLKTDSDLLFDFTLETLRDENTIIIDKQNPLNYCLSNNATEIKTKYEKKYLNEGKSIKYVCFRYRETK